MTVANSAVTTATLSEPTRLADHSGLVKKFWYHCQEKPDGGKASDFLSLNDIGTTTIVGATSQTATSRQNRPSRIRRGLFHQRLEPVLCG